jgi:hypothetical protein
VQEMEEVTMAVVAVLVAMFTKQVQFCHQEH